MPGVDGHAAVAAGLTIDAAPPRPPGLEVGTALAPFRLPDLEGRTVGLEDFRGRRVLLVNWSPHCGFCELIAADLAGLQADLRKNNVAMILVSYGDTEANRTLAREHGLTCPILLHGDASPGVEAFRDLGTPIAYLLDEQGRVAEPQAIGAEQVPALARAAARGRRNGKRLPGERPLAKSRIERDGLKAGTLAPTFNLPSVDGRTVSLDEYRGRRLLLVFTDPYCGPCEELAPDLVRLHRENRDHGLAVVMVGRGDLAENCRKAEEHGFEFAVGVQQRWELSRQYGIFATPVAFMIDERGVIAEDVARGVDEIRALTVQGRPTARGVGNGRVVR